MPFADLEARLAVLRAEHPKASHHVTAFRHRLANGQISEGAKDDGEPSGTAGMPALKVLIGREMIDTGVVIVRYFGGTKLGTGGLARAYGGSAKLALDAAAEAGTLIRWQRIIRRSLSVPFDQTSVLERAIATLSLDVEDRSFSDSGLTITVSGPKETVEELETML